MKRTATCGELTEKKVGESVVLQGWVATRRDHGGLIFIDLRDRYGLTQIVFDPKKDDVFKVAHDLRREWVIEIAGKVRTRPEGTNNDDLKTGKIEIGAESITILNKSEVPPIEIDEEIKSAEDIRLKYRYLDLRRAHMQKNLLLRHKFIQSTRNFFDKNNFIEIETPILMKPTPEGARDYLVPSRVHQGKFYALPQSPQMYKQLCMIGGVDKYFQIARCFRDEDLRADRQPEFTQLDVEMSFVDQEDVFSITEAWLQKTFEEVLDKKIEIPFKHISHKEAMDKYGCDKPDLRFGLELVDVTQIANKSGFKVFHQEKVAALPVSSDIPRKEIDKLTSLATELGAKGLAWLKYKNNAIEAVFAKHLSEKTQKELVDTLQLKENATVFFVADIPSVVNDVLSKLRIELGKKLDLIKEEFNLLWVTDFPLFSWNREEERFDPEHHPFTGIHPDDLKLLDNPKELGNIRSQSYDVVLNGVELASGSIRIHDASTQKKIFKLLNISEQDAKDRFGFFLDALKFGTPPHGGIAFGLDRLIMLIAGEESIREVIAFPKNKVAESPLDGAPANADKQQLKELKLKLEEKKEK